MTAEAVASAVDNVRAEEAAFSASDDAHTEGVPKKDSGPTTSATQEAAEATSVEVPATTTVTTHVEAAAEAGEESDQKTKALEGENTEIVDGNTVNEENSATAMADDKTEQKVTID